MPNGIITHYEVYYGRHKFYGSISNTTTGLNTNFTTPGHLEPGAEIICTVKAYTRVGGGEPATVTVSALPCEYSINCEKHIELITICAI